MQWSSGAVPESEVIPGPPSRVWVESWMFAGTIRGDINTSSLTIRDADLVDVAAWALSARARVARRFWMVEAELPLVFAAAQITDDFRSLGGFGLQDRSAVALANPSVSGSAVVPLGNSGAWLSVGGGVAASLIELKNDNAGRSQEFARAMGLSMRGNWDFWKYAPNSVSLFLPVEVEGGSERVRVGGEFGLGHSFWTGDTDPDDERDHSLTIAQVGARVVGKVSRVVSIGGRIRGVGLVAGADEDDDDRLQISGEPFVDVVFPNRLVLGGGYLFNIDEPRGPTSELFVWALRFFIGGQW